MEELSYDDYLDELEKCFVGSASKESTQSKFNLAKQDNNENISAWVTRAKMLFSSAYPQENLVNTNELLKDKFFNGLRNQLQKKFILEHKLF